MPDQQDDVHEHVHKSIYRQRLSLTNNDRLWRIYSLIYQYFTRFFSCATPTNTA